MPHQQPLLSEPEIAPFVIAHRGASAVAPENTIPAFASARYLGADWVELDVRRTTDGALAVHHDEVLADGRAVASLRRVELPSHVALLGEALAACSPLGVNVEVKPHRDLGVVEEVATVVRTWGGETIISSFQAELVERSRLVAPELPTALLTLQDPAAAIDACVAAGHRAVHPWDPTVDAALVDAAHAAGLVVNVWTVDDPERMLGLATMGVDGIVTNDVALARATFGSNG